MQAESANPLFSLASSHDCYQLPPYRASYMRRYHPYPRSGLSRTLEFYDLPMQTTTHAPYNGPRLDNLLPTIQEESSDDGLENLHNAISTKSNGARVRRLSLSTLVVDLAFAAVRQSLERRRVIRKED